GNGVLHPETGEDFEPAIVHHDWNVQDDLPGGVAEDLHYPFIQVQLMRGKVETGGLRLPGIDFLFQGNGLQSHGDLRWCGQTVRCWPAPGATSRRRRANVQSICRGARGGKLPHQPPLSRPTNGRFPAANQRYKPTVPHSFRVLCEMNGGSHALASWNFGSSTRACHQGREE